MLPGPTATFVVSATDSVCISGSEQQCNADEPIYGGLAGRNVHSVCVPVMLSTARHHLLVSERNDCVLPSRSNINCRLTGADLSALGLLLTPAAAAAHSRINRRTAMFSTAN